MFNAIKSALGLKEGEGQQASTACAQCDPAVLAECKAVEPGSVKYYTRQVLLNVAVDAEGPADQVWPRNVESMKSVDPVVRALKAAGKDGSVKDKVTLTVYAPGASDASTLAPGTADVMLFPDGVALRGVPESELAATVVGALTGPDAARVPGAMTESGLTWQSVPPLTLLVCSHMTRDKRCGVLGPQLAARLEQLLAGRSLSTDQASVLKVSHIGGHVYAGNVIVYWPGHSVHGDWFGSVHADNAEQFLTALLESPAELGGGAGDPALRPHWRGRLDLTKEQQAEKFVACGAMNRDIEDLVEQPALATASGGV